MAVGRPRKSLERRKPCGRLVQREYEPPPEDISPTPETQARRKAIFGHYEAKGELECPISILGRRLDKDQRYAARKARAIYARYSAAILPPRIVCGQLTDYVQGSAVCPMLPDDADEAKAEFEEMRRCILREVRYRYRGNPPRRDAIARQAFREVQTIMHGKLPRNLLALKLGLDAIVRHYDLADARKTMSAQQDQLEAA